MDAEGQEKVILLATNEKQWETTDMMLEVGSPENALAIYMHMTSLGVNMFSQKNNWNLASALSDIPTSYKEGSLFISTKTKMPWTI